MSFSEKVVLITGGANGFGRATGARLAGEGAHVVLADIEAEAGQEAASEIGAEFIHCDVRDPEASVAAVDFAVEKFGGLDVAFLNAGISTGCGLADTFDLELYRRAMQINLDGVVFGINAAVPAMRRRGGGSIVATASLAGLTAVPFDPIYAANKHGVVGLVRSAGPVYALESIRINGICPGFADTRIIDGFKENLENEGVPIITVEAVVDGIVDLMASDESGVCHFVQAGMDPQEFRFRNIPGPRAAEA
ncbi:MAG TPA: SDR family NAD(P)-dependent oxidoreductase [Solirubrobacterales bacterium]|nr:SDR family NAD(P)-dependent oxidoreductase [Solirubrobacterales bacterium]HMX71459.1 SDR family NAD(P)-dependent oxidoreductase [Solirubrobacterales bacterium]HMY27063.1 SDR family NAD(P)-dependent oxidoreductase [Solirubrobacterales bacterium]HNA24060.1 SDR family NAD(P)-dependent oxidoreductase [Solirubrobacterales bacterium]HNA43714.1 SDR family NAD(P)-dependent oxidoreductase [Solirubrobacterales bacterium]